MFIESNSIKKIIENEIPNYEAKIKALRDQCVDLEVDLADLDTSVGFRRSMSNANSRVSKMPRFSETRRRKSSAYSSYICLCEY